MKSLLNDLDGLPLPQLLLRQGLFTLRYLEQERVTDKPPLEGCAEREEETAESGGEGKRRDAFARELKGSNSR